MAGEPLHLPDKVKSLPVGWEWFRLDAICDAVVDCPHSTPILTETGPLLARSQDIRTGVFWVEMAGRVSEETYKERITRAEPRHGDLLYSREGTYFGIAALVPPDTRVCLGQRMVLIRPNTKRMDPRFLLYWLNSPVIASHIFGFRDGTVAERLNLPTIRGLPVAVPSRNEQHAIARILGTLDDKIELNRRMNRTLERLARAVFRSWFVDFDPVVAKAAGRRPVGMHASTAALFPDSFVDSPLGPIPKGWSLRTLADLTSKIGSGSTPTGGRSVYVEQGVAFIRSQNVYDHEFNWSGLARLTDEAANKLRGVTVQPGDVLINITGESILPTCVVDPDVLPARVNQHVSIVRSQPGIPPRFLHLHLVRQELKDYLIGHDAGGTRQAITKVHLEAVPLVTPSPELLRAFQQVTDPLFSRSEFGRRHSRTLAALRNALLPRLLSGELRLKHTERAVGAVV
jgi:type I restriction enzyme S subunit